jgi:alpha-glucosidase
VTLYAFKILPLDGPQQWLGSQGPAPRIPGLEAHFRFSSDTPPAWIPHQVFYQVFPDRFCNGDPTLSVRDNEYAYGDACVSQRAWGELPRNEDAHRCSEFFGGDLPGLVSQLPYLQDLGITALYLNPIFSSPSNHKYDCADYLNVDPHLGGNAALEQLRVATRAANMRLVLDAVFNHSSAQHPFLDLYGHRPDGQGAYAGVSSPCRGEA